MEIKDILVFDSATTSYYGNPDFVIYLKLKAKEYLSVNPIFQAGIDHKYQYISWLKGFDLLDNTSIKFYSSST